MCCHRASSHRSRLLAIAGAIITIVAATSAFAATRYVSPGGSDLNPGTSHLPLATVQAAVNASIDGDTVLLANGTYSGLGNVNIDLSGKSIRIASSSGVPTACIIDCSSAAIATRYGFIFSGYYTTPAELEGLTVTGARSGNAAAGALMMPDGASLEATGVGPVLTNVRVVGNTGNGFYVGAHRRMFTAYDCTFSNNTGSGGISNAVYSMGGHSFVRCQFVDNGVSGYRSGAYSSVAPGNVYEDCIFSGNAQDGFVCINAIWQVEHFNNCTFAANGGHGVSVKYAGHFTGCTMVDNVGWGVWFPISVSDPGGLTIDTCAVERNQAGGIACIATETMMGNLNVLNSTILDNGGAGFTGIVDSSAGSISGCVIAGNAGPGVELKPTVPGTYPNPVNGHFDITQTTIDGNTGIGLYLRFENGHDPARDLMAVNVSRTIISRHATGTSIAGMAPGALSVTCSDIWGNTAGNWVGALAPFAGLYGNLSADPIYCGSVNTDDPWSIAAVSPCSSASSTCGSMGARGVGCGTYIDWCDLHDPPILYAPAWGQTGIVTGYAQIIGVTSAAGATPGLVAQVGWGPTGSDPAGRDWTWTAATYYRDLHGMDIFRGTFAVRGSGTYAFAYRYGRTGGPWVYADLDGSANGYLAEQAGQLVVGSASGTPDVVPATLRLHAAQPNPFNPSTSLRFDVPTAGFVRLAVYDLAGRLVRTLVAEELKAATHTATWDGCNDSGRPVGAGIYAARLESAGGVETVGLSLVK
jgi:hypothetical protein